MDGFSHKSIRASTLAREVFHLFPVLPLLVSLIVPHAAAQTNEIIEGRHLLLNLLTERRQVIAREKYHHEEHEGHKVKSGY